MTKFYFLLFFIPSLSFGQISWEKHYDSLRIDIQSMQFHDNDTIYLTGLELGQPVMMYLDTTQNISLDTTLPFHVPFVPDIITKLNPHALLMIKNKKDTIQLGIVNDSTSSIWTTNLFLQDVIINTAIIINDDKLLLGGRKNNNMFLVCLNKNEQILWTKNFGGIGVDEILCLTKINNNRFLAGGYIDMFNAGETDIFVMEIDSLGTNIWEKVLGEPDISEKLHLIALNKNHQPILVGNASDAIWVIELSDQQDVDQQFKIATENMTFLPTALCKNKNNHLIIGAMVQSGLSAPHFYIVDCFL